MAAGLWLLAASFLWRTSVPHDLRLPHLRSASFLAPAEIHRAEHFSAVLTWLIVGGTLVELAVLLLVAVFGVRLAAAFPVGRIGRGVLVGCLAGTLVWAATLPFDLATTWWERRYGLVLTGYGAWAADAATSLAAMAVGMTLAVALLMALAAALPRVWWLAGSVVVAAIVIGVSVVQPLLTFDTHPIRDPALAAAVQRMERREGVTGTRVDVEKVSGHTNEVNAMTFGLGPTERVVLWDTLLDRFSRRQVVVVAAHELGHVRSRHILKGMGWAVLIIVPALFLVALATRRRGGPAQPGAVPVALLVLGTLAFLIAPAYNVVSRRYEAEADWRALNASRDPQAAIGVFEGLSRSDLEEPNPPTWEYVFFADHPTVLQRIGMVRAWQARNGRR